MRKVFNQFDTSKDGSLDALELRCALRVALGVDVLGLGSGSGSALALGSGLRLGLRLGLGLGSSNPNPNPNPKTLIRCALRAALGVDVSASDVDRLIGQIDNDGNGVLNFDEFMGICQDKSA